jgi:hypothetical protein
MFLESGAWPVRRVDNLTAISEPIVYTMWDPQHPTTLQTSTACYRDRCPYPKSNDSSP